MSGTWSCGSYTGRVACSCCWTRERSAAKLLSCDVVNRCDLHIQQSTDWAPWRKQGWHAAVSGGLSWKSSYYIYFITVYFVVNTAREICCIQASFSKVAEGETGCRLARIGFSLGVLLSDPGQVPYGSCPESSRFMTCFAAGWLTGGPVYLMNVWFWSRGNCWVNVVVGVPYH